MNKLFTLTACAICFILGTAANPFFAKTTAHAQDTAAQAKTTYYNISFYKSLPGQDPMKWEKDKWKPIHDEMVKSGQIKSWLVLEPMYSGDHLYDYMTVVGTDDIESYHKIKYNLVFQKIWGDKWLDTLKQSLASRDQIGNELWSVVTESH